MTASRPPGDPGVFAAGTRVGHYDIIEKIGEGGEAIVYRARDVVLERDVALKTPPYEFASPEDRARLLREARAASRLSHPNIVSIYEVFEDLGRPWFAMDLVEGATLRTILGHRGALPEEEVVRYGEMLADALRAAHAKQILHRDVTPSNIFLTPGGRLLLADFGLALLPAAHSAGDADAPTQSLSQPRVAGTMGYMSPEQVLGRMLGPQSDIFSAGAVLYQMATGTRAFGGATLGEIIDATLHREPPPVARTGQGNPELERIIRKAIAKRPDERYASAEDLLIDLRSLRRRLESGGVDRIPIPEPARKRYRVAAMVAAGAVAVAAGIWAWVALRPAALPTATPHQVTAGGGWEADARISPDGSDIVYAARGADGNVDIWLVDARGGTPIRLTDDPAPDSSPAWFPDGSAIAFASERGGTPGVWRINRLGGQPPTLIVASAGSPAISPDGTRIAFTRPNAGGLRRIAVAPLADAANARILTTDRDGLWNHESPAWSPDGRTICYAGHTDLWTVTADGGRPERLTKDGEADFEPAWSPDGRWVYFSSMREDTTAIWRVAARGGTSERVTMGSGPERQPSLSKDGSRLTYSTFSLNSNVVVRVEQTGKEYEFGGERRELYPAFAPDGSAVAYVSEQLKSPPDLWIQPLSPDGSPAGEPRRLTDHPGSAAYPSYSPDGRWIAYHRALKGERDIWIVPAAGGAPVRFTDDPAIDIHPVWSPDGGQIAFVSDRGGGSHIWLAPVAGGKAAGPARRLTTGALSEDQPSWSPDASMIAFLATDATGKSETWMADARTAGPGRQITGGADAALVAWSASPGQLLVSGSWGTGPLRLMWVEVATGRATPAGPPDLFGEQSDDGVFALSRDGRLLAVIRQVGRGDVWVLEATHGRY